MHPVDKYLDQKGAAASPPPPLGVSIHLGGALGPPLKVGPAPGQHKVSGGPLGSPPETNTYLEYRKGSGVHILHCSFISYIINESMQNT